MSADPAGSAAGPEPITPDTLRTGIAQSLLREIAERLAALAEGGEDHAIDLRSLPMTPADHAELAEALGEGEVDAKLTILGESRARETGVSGVWWITHYGDRGEVANEVIEICRVPDILSSHPADIGHAAARLRAALAEGNGDVTKEVGHG